MDLSSLAAATPLDALKPLAAAPSAVSGQAAGAADKVAATAKKFEASFLQVMIGSMFEGVSTSGAFGGGQGEQAFRSFLTDEMAKGVSKRGGVGLASAVQREMLRMQGGAAAQAPMGSGAGAATASGTGAATGAATNRGITA